MADDSPVLRSWNTVWRGYRFVFANFRLCLLAASLLVAFWTFRLFPHGNTVPNALLPEWLYYILTPFFVGYFAVGWHRFVLLDEPPLTFRYGAREFKYFLFAFGLSVLFGLPMDLAAFFPEGGAAPLLLIPVGIIVFAIWLIYPFFLPGISLGHPMKAIWKAWREFGNNRGRFILMQLLASGAAFVVFALAIKFAGSFLRVPLWLLLGKESEFAWLGGTTISATAITEFVVALFLALIISVIVAAEMSSLSFAYKMAEKHSKQEVAGKQRSSGSGEDAE